VKKEALYIHNTLGKSFLDILECHVRCKLLSIFKKLWMCQGELDKKYCAKKKKIEALDL